ncbi:putative methyltransferase C9orf114 [Galendromus occidentalis]|uniref:Methyltransferase C9orf114 n=1 Tax=Galendromus occidentalis TaxID=34638 RepID=A0AAJ6QUZ8_9ACAR|nr:putative methyltransferase C9orf114 [Galendromus occidentalis]
MKSTGESPDAKRAKIHEKPSADALLSVKKSKKRTISIAVCASMLENLKGEGSKHRVIAQIARAAAIFRVNEVIVVDDAYKNPGFDSSKDSNLFQLILEYLDCPQYLRKSLFPMCLELKHIGVAPPLDASHHVRMEDEVPYREGIVTRVSLGSVWLDVGLHEDIKIESRAEVKQGLRVTVNMTEKSIVGPDTPRKKDGLYWGYRTRVAKSISEVIALCPFEKGYDMTIGTSERGESILELEALGKFRHLLIVFGGPKGLEHALEQDKALTQVKEPKNVFDKYLNTCPLQGSRTIRTEEAVLISLSALQKYFWCS